MIGTWLNVSGIVLGGIIGLVWKKPLSMANQLAFRRALGVSTVCCGLYLTFMNLKGSVLQIFGQIGIVMLSLVLGRLTGRVLHLQKASNRAGQFARERMAKAGPGNPDRFSDGFNVCALLFCVAPLGILGAIHDGLSGYFFPLAIKAVMDGLATMSFVAMFGVGVALSAVPVLFLQGTITLLCARFLLPFLESRHLLESVNATGGLLILCVALLIFEVRKVEITDYLPSLLFAPLLTSWLR